MEEDRKIKIKKKEKRNKKNNTNDSLILILFLTWFVGSIVGMVIASSLGNETVTIILFGQYFFVFSMMVFSDSRAPLFPLIHLTVGIGAMVIPFIIKMWPQFTDMTMSGWIDFYKPIISIVAGYVFLIISRNKEESEFKTFYGLSWLFYVLGIIKIIIMCW